MDLGLYCSPDSQSSKQCYRGSSEGNILLISLIFSELQQYSEQQESKTAWSNTKDIAEMGSEMGPKIQLACPL